jgi:hypothetical protein
MCCAGVLHRVAHALCISLAAEKIVALFLHAAPSVC